MSYGKPLRRVQVLLVAVAITYFIASGTTVGEPVSRRPWSGLCAVVVLGFLEVVAIWIWTNNAIVEVTFQIPEELGYLLPNHEVLSRVFLEAYAADAYRNEKLTRYEVGQLLGLERWQSEDFLTRRNAQRPFGSTDMELERASLLRE